MGPWPAALALVAGSLALVVGVLLLRGTGQAWRLGRLLAAAPPRSLAEVADMAATGQTAYVRIHGRVSSSEVFPDENDRPLVFRRRRLQRLRGRHDWQTFEDDRVAVPFGLEERGHQVAIDETALGDGLVVVPRVADGVAADLEGRGLAVSSMEGVSGTAPDTPVRLRIDEVSAVDHATAAGVPTLDLDGRVMLTAGLGRPLILNTLEADAAMRVLAAGRRTRVMAATGLLVTGPALLAVGLVLGLLALLW
jgi:hypothetical protein